ASDRAAEVVDEWIRRRAAKNTTLLRSPLRQGTGGSQKLGYRLAVEAGFAGVVYLPDNGRDDPAQVGRIASCLREGRADVVLGVPPEPAHASRLGGPGPAPRPPRPTRPDPPPRPPPPPPPAP